MESSIRLSLHGDVSSHNPQVIALVKQVLKKWCSEHGIDFEESWQKIQDDWQFTPETTGRTKQATKQKPANDSKEDYATKEDDDMRKEDDATKKEENNDEEDIDSVSEFSQSQQEDIDSVSQLSLDDEDEIADEVAEEVAEEEIGYRKKLTIDGKKYEMSLAGNVYEKIRNGFFHDEHIGMYNSKENSIYCDYY